MRGEGVEPVLQAEHRLDALLVGELLLHADRDERKAQPIGERRSEDDASRLDPADHLEAGALVALGQSVDHLPEDGGVLEDRRDVAVADAGLREVDDLLDEFEESFG